MLGADPGKPTLELKMESAVAAMCVEAGYVSANREAIEVLAQVLQSYIKEIGHTSNVYCEVAQRSVPTVSDIHLAFIELGARFMNLEEYAQRPQRRHIPRQLRSYPNLPGKVLQVGSHKKHPPHISANFPSYPDNHTFLKTPTYSVPDSDYCILKEKMATQNKCSRENLSTLISRVCPSIPVTCHSLLHDIDVYKVLLPEASEKPAFINGLVPQEIDLAQIQRQDEQSKKLGWTNN
ncbi:PREDICTED: transcription initiation factor TFIID subunit 8-like [Amphimedon queenslandica]|uniref:Transcription initiation factor TFIID subunit 8 n=1 Tax=Amphimedon queenslandica TaxID=400682 RepID=A0A1X7UJC8_AMPQE|nr:PREDICTED: transcription initiation factor TFIID subunit 8-like [Amphimedon queenslandica]|eukprot:XP_011404894.2 PREDICTED: transcription initiation factor TFIID subunit 8-like [Amphimedon queenslandica]